MASASPLPQATITDPSTDEEEVSITASDGLAIRGTFRPGDGPGPHPGVLLLHMIYGSRMQWQDFAPQLSQAGYASLAIDMRGHGETGGKADWTQARDDLQRAWEFLAARPEVDPQRTAIVGASMGANMALVSGTAEARVKALVLLSPGLNYYGVQTEDPIAKYGKRPVLIVVSRDDSYAAASSQKLSELAQGAVQLQLYEHAGHGTEMLERQPELGALILSWLNQQLGSTGSS